LPDFKDLGQPMLKMLETKIYGNDLFAWSVALLLAVAILAIGLFAKLFLLRRLPEKRPGEDLRWTVLFRDLIERTSILFLVFAALYAGAWLLKLPPVVAKVLFSAFVVAFFVQCALWADRIVAAALVWQLAPRRTKASMRNALSLIEVLVRAGIWTLAALLIFENLGFDVTALIAGLGIGGVAVALAAQRVLGDLFSSLAIVLDRPFEVGDVIQFGDQSGTVEKIGIKTTRLRSTSGEQIVCANSDLIESRIHNYKRMAERRILFRLSVPYDTEIAKLERIPGLLREIVEAQGLTRFERAHLLTLGDSALLFEIVYWVLSADGNLAMDIQQAINLAVLRRFEEERIAFAYPTQTVFVPELKAALSAESERPRLRLSGGT
jgi:small-conductance mechanosensitive channel